MKLGTKIGLGIIVFLIAYITFFHFVFELADKARLDKQQVKDDCYRYVGCQAQKCYVEEVVGNNIYRLELQQIALSEYQICLLKRINDNGKYVLSELALYHRN